MNLIQQLEQEEIARLGKTIPEFAPGDTVVVHVRVVEGNRSRLQAYEGVVISRRNRGLNSNFIVRKISSGEGVERTFQLYSPTVEKIEVKRRGDVRRAKLYYLRGLTGKAARIKEKLPARKGQGFFCKHLPFKRQVFCIGKFKLFEILICMGLFYANGYMLLMRCRKETVYCFEKSAIRDEVRLVGMQCLFSG